VKKKGELPLKYCVVCGLPFAWRKKWARCWNEVRYCSARCRRSRKGWALESPLLSVVLDLQAAASARLSCARLADLFFISEPGMTDLNLSTDETRVSYGIGRQLGDQLRDNPPPGVSLDAVIAGIRDAFAGIASQVSPEALNASFAVIRERMQAEAQQKAEAAAAEGRAFLVENAKREGVVVLESGLQYEVLTTGEGAKPSREDSVRTHYHGTLIDGSVFDSSYQRGQPAEFPVGGVIAGWTEALQLMNAGSKWRLYVPSELAYGAQGVGSIPPHSTLVFDVELLDVL